MKTRTTIRAGSGLASGERTFEPIRITKK